MWKPFTMWSKRAKLLTAVLAELLILGGLCAALFARQETQTPQTTDPELSAATAAATVATTDATPSTTVTAATTQPQTEPVTLSLQCREEGYNVYTLTWSEDSGGCRLWRSDDEGQTWQAAGETDAATHSYTTEHLPAFSTLWFRVETADGTSVEQCVVTTAEQPIYSTVWPLVTLTVYAEADGAETIGTVEAGTALCVLEEAGDYFRVRFSREQEGYIDSRYCMIDLPEYLGDLCAYSIVNAESALYMVHDYAIGDVTGTVITGYENVRLADGTDLVPLLYPAAQKLAVAARDARAQGYRLRIYDSFRPHAASKSIYALTERIVDTPVPEDPAGQTYRELMTDNGRYRLSNFLANGVSRHNLGVALDLTLETLEGQELAMQSAIHDLSWYAALERNNENADLLQSIMVAAGFTTLDSEWWHFSDGEAYAELALSYLYDGVSCACWVRDDAGWRYRLVDGSYARSQELTIDGVCYCFDAAGYATAL